MLCVSGNCANAKTLIEAGAATADILLATTASDEVNMLCCLIGKKLGAAYTIARIRDPQYNDSLMLLQSELGIDTTINPERATALEISRLLRFPFANNIESFAKGHVEMVEFRPSANDAVVGHPLHELSSVLPNHPRVLYAALERRDGEVIIPSGNDVIAPGDRVFVAGDLVSITNYFRSLGKNSLRVKNVMIMGGGRISYYLARIIVPMGINVTMIEIDPDKAATLSEQLPKVKVILGDGTDQELLEQLGLGSMDAYIALSDRDEENLMTGLFASRLSVPKVIVKNNRHNYAGLINDLGLDSIVSPKAITGANILRYVRARVSSEGTTIEKLYRLLDGKAEALEFNVHAGAPYINVPLKDLNVASGAIVAVIVRRGKVIVPFGNDHIEAGDSVIIVTRSTAIHDLNEVLKR